MFLHDALGDCQTESGSAASFGVKRFKNPGQVFVRDAWSGVANCALDPLLSAVRYFLRFDGDNAQPTVYLSLLGPDRSPRELSLIADKVAEALRR